MTPHEDCVASVTDCTPISCFPHRMNEAVRETVDAVKKRPTISTLPWGPLENVILFLREQDLAQVLQACKDLSTLDSETFWRERCCDAFGRHLSCVEVRASGGNCVRVLRRKPQGVHCSFLRVVRLHCREPGQKLHGYLPFSMRKCKG